MVHWHSNRYLKCLKPSISPRLGRCHYCRFDGHTEISAFLLFGMEQRREVDLYFSSLWEEMKSGWVETTNMLPSLVSVYASTSCEL